MFFSLIIKNKNHCDNSKS